ncbi:MAG TPA: hypothetical protein EYN07_01265 [Flavobacteriaceae bacterium]|nr:hypothetical protein [Flavobacteriaceae bacterium]HIN97847.1 hypothetical protein [Flavobacteriaceae bacterium]
MIKLFSISFSFLILLQSFGISFSDVAQLDEFIEHAQFHSEQYGDNVFVFISKHYGELKANHHKEHEEEKEDHEELPFNHSSCFHITSLPAFVLNTIKVEISAPDFLDRTDKPNFHYQAPTSSFHSLGLLQPPRHS